MSLSGFFFNFESFDREIEKKLASLGAPAETLMQAFLRQIQNHGMPEEDCQRLARLFDQYLAESGFAREKNHYLSHPIRVAASFFDCLQLMNRTPVYADMALALCHNLKEKMGDVYSSAAVPDDFFPREAKALMELMTIDRARERDPHYLDSFYTGIENAKYPLMLLKALDKLDNTFWWAALDLEPYHAEIVLKWVCPRIARSHTELGRYLEELTRYVISPAAKQKFGRTPARPQTA